MKTKTLAFLLFILAANVVSAQSAFDKWPAIKDFHTVISQTYHPSEEGNLEPIKTRSQELVDKASALTQSDIPAEFRTKAILSSVEKLQAESKALHQLVIAKAADMDITKALSGLHDTFHEIVGLCTEEKK